MKVNKMLIKIAIKNNVAPCFLSYIGYMLDVFGKKVYCFNVEDDKHPKYRSTIAIRENDL